VLLTKLNSFLHSWVAAGGTLPNATEGIEAIFERAVIETHILNPREEEADSIESIQHIISMLPNPPIFAPPINILPLKDTIGRVSKQNDASYRQMKTITLGDGAGLNPDALQYRTHTAIMAPYGQAFERYKNTTYIPARPV